MIDALPGALDSFEEVRAVDRAGRRYLVRGTARVQIEMRVQKFSKNSNK